MTADIEPTALSPAAEAYDLGVSPDIRAPYTVITVLEKRHQRSKSYRRLGHAQDRAIVVPNNDTLCSSGWYDLRHGDLLIDVPPMDHPHRYWNVMIADAYTHVAYVCRRHHGVRGTQVRVTMDPATPPTNDDSELVSIGTPATWVIIRVLVESPDDIKTARELQHGITVTAPASHPHRTERAGRATTIAQAGADYFAELKRYIDLDPPAHWHRDYRQQPKRSSTILSSVTTEELAAGVAEGEQLILRGNGSDAVKRNGWSTGRAATGSGDDILKRAIGANSGWVGIKP